MKSGRFIWADLSTYATAPSIQFYKKVFNWKIKEEQGYHLAWDGDAYQAGIFETPDYLKEIKMPHFWMSYFQVSSVEKAVSIAREMQSIIEVDTTDFYNGKIALIRDPQGAGFTIYDGDNLYFQNSKDHGTIWRTELHVSNVQAVIPFYSKLFNWSIIEVNANEYRIDAQNQEKSIGIKEFQNEIKGKYEYWVMTFIVQNLAVTTDLIIANGGTLITKEKTRNLMTDNSGEAFFYIEELIG